MNVKIVAVLVIALGLWACSARKNKLESQVLEEAAEIRKLVQKHVQDEGRRDKLLAIQARIEATTESFFNSLVKTRREWETVNADFDSRPDTFAGLQRQSSAIRRQHGETLIACAMDARRIATRAEWEAMASEWKD